MRASFLAGVNAGAITAHLLGDEEITDSLWSEVRLRMTFDNTTIEDVSPTPKVMEESGTGDIELVTGKFGSAPRKTLTTAADRRINAVTVADFYMPTNNWTIELWVWHPAASTKSGIIMGQHDAGFNIRRSYWLSIVAGVLRFHTNTNEAAEKTVDDTAALTDSTWHHVVAERSGSTIRLYRDGTFRAKITEPGSLRSFLGSFHAAHQNWMGGTNGAHDGGLIDDLRITDLARYENDVGYPLPTKKMPVSGPPPSVPSGPGYDWELIAHLGSPTAGAFTFTGLDLSEYERVEVHIDGVQSATDSTTVQVRFRVGAGPTDASHRWALWSESTGGGTDAVLSAGPAAQANLVADAAAFPLGNAATDAFAGVLSLSDLAAATERSVGFKGSVGYAGGSANMGWVEGVIHITETDPITGITILGSAALTAGKVTIVGLREVG